jgi:orotate phosphoribosyltransferase
MAGTGMEPLPAKIFHAGGIGVDIRAEGGYLLEIHSRSPERRKSNIFFDLRDATNPKGGKLTQDIIDAIGKEMYYTACEEGLTYDGIAGLPNAGTPLAAAFKKAASAAGRDVPLILMQKGPDGPNKKRGPMEIIDDGGLDVIHGNRNAIVLAIDDIITAGGTKDNGIRTIEAAGYKVRDVLVWIDREQGGAEHLARNNIQLHSSRTAASIVRLLEVRGLISSQEKDEVIDYLTTEKY